MPIASVYRQTENDPAIYDICCGKCGGVGYLREYGHVDSGVCFQCGGAGILGQATEEEYRKVEKRRAYQKEYRMRKAQEAAEKEKAETEKAFSELEKKFAEEFKAILTFKNNSMFVLNAKSDILHRQPLSENIISSVMKMISQAENATDVPVGRQIVTGEIVSVKFVDDMYSFNGGMITKIVVDCGTFRLYGTLPKVAETAENGAKALKGKKISFTATVEAGKEKGFGFFKRPTKAQIIS